MTTRRSLSRLILGAVLAAPALGALSLPAMAQPVPPPYPPYYRPLPPPRYERRPPPPPGPSFIWAPGHWVWNGYRYRWVGGHYVRRASGWHRWVDGHWAVAGGAWRWVPGHWV